MTMPFYVSALTKRNLAHNIHIKQFCAIVLTKHQLRMAGAWLVSGVSLQFCEQQKLLSIHLGKCTGFIFVCLFVHCSFHKISIKILFCFCFEKVPSKICVQCTVHIIYSQNVSCRLTIDQFKIKTNQASKQKQLNRAIT